MDYKYNTPTDTFQLMYSTVRYNIVIISPGGHLDVMDSMGFGGVIR